MQKTDRIILYSIAIIVLALCGWTIKDQMSKREVSYIDIGKLVDNYQLKKDLENSTSQNLYKIKNVMDSLEMHKKLSGGNPHVDSQLMHAQLAFEQYYTLSSQQISKSVWERLNPVIEEFGKERGLRLLIGANGAGNVLYGDKANDMTDELIKYINARYEKGN